MAKKPAAASKKPASKPAKAKPKPVAKAKPTAKAKPAAKAQSIPRTKPSAKVNAKAAPSKPVATSASTTAIPAPPPVPAPVPIAATEPAPITLPTQITKKFIDALTHHLKRLPTAGESLGATDYILEGEPADALLRIAAEAEAGRSLALAGISTNIAYDLRQHIHAERLGVYRDGVEAPPAVWQRFGEVLDAAARASGRKAGGVSGWPVWLSCLIGELCISFNEARGSEKQPAWPAERLVPLFADAKQPASEVVRMLFDSWLQSSLRLGTYCYASPAQIFSNWPEFLATNLPAIRQAITRVRGNASSALRTLAELKFDFTPVIDLVAEVAGTGNKATRDMALPILHKNASTAIPYIDKFLTDGNVSQRNEAASLLWKIDPKNAPAKLQARLKVEPAEKVKQTIEKLLAVPTVPEDSEPLVVPPLELETGFASLPTAARDRIKKVYERAHEIAMKDHEQRLARFNGPDKPQWMDRPTKPEPIATAQLDQLFEFLSGGLKTLLSRDQYRRPGIWGMVFPDESFTPPGTQLIHVVRLDYALSRFDLDRSDGIFYWGDISNLEAYRARCEKPFGLRELDAAVASLPNGKPGTIIYAYLLTNTKYRDFCDWEPEAIWPAFAEHLDMLRDALTGATASGVRDYYITERKRNAFKILAMFPKLPPGFLPILWDLALGDAKTDRKPAQEALKSLPNKAGRVAVGLTNSRQTIREAAAEWLGNIGDTSAIEPLKNAFRKEKIEATKGIIMVALEKLGADVSEFLDRKKLAKEAEEGMKTPPKLWGITIDGLPPIHWQDTGKPVDPKIVQWWVVQAVAQNSPASGPILRRYLAQCRPTDTTALAKHILTMWLDKSGARGALALVAAGADADCVRMAERFIRQWFGQKMSQCKSLIEMIAWVKHPMALQVLLSISNRFRTASLRKLAGEFVNAIAEREGWTVDELADRTIPDGGFAKPEGGGRPALVLDYGARQFTATLDDELEPVITGEVGKVVRALPAPAKADDAVKGKEAKKIFSDAKKQVKDVVKRQSERLYEALCTQRAWTFADWKQFLCDHPIVGRLCVRLVWQASEPGENGKFLGCFRPLEDGSLTNEKDDSVTLSDDTVIRLAHTANTPVDVATAWKQHLTDYNVQPIFDQFGRAAYVHPEAKAKDTAITDFRGYEMGTFQMRGRLTKAGYLRGEAQDGGWFHEYLKPFRSLGIQAEIGFTGNSLPEEDRRAALGSLTFVKIKPDGEAAGGRWNSKPLELGKVPPVLLSECYNDLKQLAAEGTGFNPEWEKKSYY
ncbi:MAG: DUF4132 domain-containing protein [Gemmataceae bacterium]